MSNNSVKSVFDYINLEPKDKMNYFLSSITQVVYPPKYWIDFETVDNKIASYSKDISALNYLKGKSETQIYNFFRENPNLIKYIPVLLGIRNNKLKSNTYLEVMGLEEQLELNINSPGQLDKWMMFMRESGLLDVLQNKLQHDGISDYIYGLEAGLNTNARKNRSGKNGEKLLKAYLDHIAEIKSWQTTSQASEKIIKKKYKINMPDMLKNRIFDGSLFDPIRKKLYLFEVNVFNSGGSKSKAAATEFHQLKMRLSTTNNEFIYITDGLGWRTDKSHLKEAMENIGLVFNFSMLQKGWLDDYFQI